MKLPTYLVCCNYYDSKIPLEMYNLTCFKLGDMIDSHRNKILQKYGKSDFIYLFI
jgi:hypothetical protein